jgi:hypothetical protein
VRHYNGRRESASVATDLEPMRAEERQVRLRARPAARKRWEEAAALRRESLSEFLRVAADQRASRRPREEVAETWLSPQAQPARAIPLEERLAAIRELVDGLDVAPRLPHPAGGDAETETTSALARLLTD